MKVIFSRKGFDSEYGGSPSPILADQETISLPIPGDETLTFGDVSIRNGSSVAALLTKLKVKQHNSRSSCHLDPDLYSWSLPRKRSWRPSFGQSGAAQSHLQNQGVGPGDIFLFFGFFQQTRNSHESIQFVPGKFKHKHVLYGWLQVDKVLNIGPTTSVPQWLAYHPHCAPRHRNNINNCIYIARKKLSFDQGYPGSGSFRCTSQTMLTKPGKTRSCWNLDPKIFGHLDISYHSAKSWKEDHFRSASKGQEFVLTADRGVEKWVHRLIKSSSVC